MDENSDRKWERIRERKLADPAAQSRYEHKRDVLIAVRDLLQTIEQEREKRQLSKADLATVSGLQPAAVRRLLTAASGNPTLRTVIGVADALGFEIALRPKSVSADPTIPDRPSRRRGAIAESG